jgi:hypothetical protein
MRTITRFANDLWCATAGAIPFIVPEARQSYRKTAEYGQVPAWITSRALCKDNKDKICAWTSAHKTVLTARPERTPFL